MPAIVALVPGRLLNMSALAIARLNPEVHRSAVYDLKRSRYFLGRR